MLQVRDRATLYLAELDGHAGGPEAIDVHWSIPPKNLEKSLRAYLENGTDAPFDLVSTLLIGLVAEGKVERTASCIMRLYVEALICSSGCRPQCPGQCPRRRKRTRRRRAGLQLCPSRWGLSLHAPHVTVDNCIHSKTSHSELNALGSTDDQLGTLQSGMRGSPQRQLPTSLEEKTGKCILLT